MLAWNWKTELCICFPCPSKRFCHRGYGRVYSPCTRAQQPAPATGNAMAFACRMCRSRGHEFPQFHPTGIYELPACLDLPKAPERCRGYLTILEGGALMERYAPTAKTWPDGTCLPLG